MHNKVHTHVSGVLESSVTIHIAVVIWLYLVVGG